MIVAVTMPSTSTCWPTRGLVAPLPWTVWIGVTPATVTAMSHDAVWRVSSSVVKVTVTG